MTMDGGQINGRPIDVGTAADLIGRSRADDVHAVDLADGRRAYVRVMTLAELELFQGGWDASSGEARRDTMARIILATACDKDGGLLFRPDQLDDVRTIKARDALALSNRSLEVNRLTEDAVIPLKKNSPATIESD